MTIYGFNSKKCTPPYCNNNALINKNLYCEHYYHYYRPFDKIQYCNHCKFNHCGLSLQKTNFKSRLTLHFIWIDTWFCLFLAKFIIVCPSIAFAICIFKRREDCISYFQYSNSNGLQKICFGNPAFNLLVRLKLK